MKEIAGKYIGRPLANNLSFLPVLLKKNLVQFLQ